MLSIYLGKMDKAKYYNYSRGQCNRKDNIDQYAAPG